ncbi:hypothetical protein BGZ70_001296 [Mortierella alpina]|uniref:Uncharacterized protein n=1 Tax=Mortierella alpina TaxID=64518 RepID=A0A9P6LY80_MORAP|nr:hypothetical protein BGZ70_001296 [Mortierella alpina]
MAKTAAIPPTLGGQGTMRKKSKKMRLLRNPFSDTGSLGASSTSSPSSFRNPFCDSFALIHTYGDVRSSETNGDEDGDEEEDEARIMHARRQALVALDPTNKDSWKAEFKSLKEYSLKKMNLEQQRRQDLESQQKLQQSRKRVIMESSHEPLEVLDEPQSDQDHEEKEDQVVPEAIPSVSLRRPQESSDPYDTHNRHSRQSLFSTPKAPKRPDADVPEISISLATPPSSSSSSSTPNDPHEPSCSVVADPSLLSTTYTPSPLSLSALDPLDASWQQNLSPEKAKAKERRTTVVYKSLLKRVSPSTPAIVRPVLLGASSTVEDSGVNPLGAPFEGEGTIAARPLAPSSWSLNRNTFGAFSKLDPRHPLRDEQDPQLQSQPTTKAKSKRKSRLFRKQRSSRHALDPCDSSDDMLIQVTDDDDGTDSETPFSGGRESFLKGRMGVRRTSIGARTETDQGGIVSRSLEKGSGGVVEDWIVHPRTAAIRGTFHRVHEAVPVPGKDSRPSSLGPEFLTISLASPPRHTPKHQTFGDGGTSLTRAQSTDSPLTPLRKGASAFLSGFGNVSLPVQGSSSQAAMDKDMAESTQIRRMMNGQALPLADRSSPRSRQSEIPHPRSSMMTFGSRMSTNSPPRITMSSSFASFRDLISSATGLVRSSSSVSETATTTATTMFAPFSPATNLSRAQSTAYGGGGGAVRHSVSGVHSSGTGGISFSPGSRRKTALVMMAPTIFVAQKASSTSKDEKKNKNDSDASSMHTISSSLNSSASSSLTTLASGLDQPHDDKDRTEKEQPAAGPDTQGRYPVSDSSEPMGHAAPITGLTPPRHTVDEQRLPTTTMKPRHHSLLKVPEPAKAGSSSHHHHHHPRQQQQHSPPTSVAASAMAAAQRAWLSSLGLTRGERELIRSTSTRSIILTSSIDSLAGPLTGDDYIGQFERERAKARGMSMTTTGAGSFATTAETESSSSSSTTLTTTLETPASDHEGHSGSSRGELRKKNGAVVGDETHSRPALPPPVRRSHTSPNTDKSKHSSSSGGGANGFRRSFLQTIRIRPESSGPLDMSDKLMHLPEPSRFEGMCSCRGVINIASMLLILLGLVLLILGYPIASSLNKDRVAAEAATGISATVPANAPGSDVLVAAAAAVSSSSSSGAAGFVPQGPNTVTAEKRSVLLRATEDVPTTMVLMMVDKRNRFARASRSLKVVFPDELDRKGTLA